MLYPLSLHNLYVNYILVELEKTSMSISVSLCVSLFMYVCMCFNLTFMLKGVGRWTHLQIKGVYGNF